MGKGVFIVSKSLMKYLENIPRAFVWFIAILTLLTWNYLSIRITLFPCRKLSKTMLLIVLKFFVFNWWALSFPCDGPLISPFYHCSHQQGLCAAELSLYQSTCVGGPGKRFNLPYCVDICELGGNTALTEPPHWVCPRVLYWGTSSGQSERPGGSVCFFLFISHFVSQGCLFAT